MVIALVIGAVLIACVLWLLREATRAVPCDDPNCCPPDMNIKPCKIAKTLEEQGASPEYIQKVKAELCGPFGRTMP